jgi:hypothetical protein
VESSFSPPRMLGSGRLAPAGLFFLRERAISISGAPMSSLNAVTAVKTGLTSRTVLLPADAAAEYQRHLAAFEQELQPVGPRECELAQSIADTWWRLRRIPALEMAFFAKGRIEFADLFKECELDARPHLIDAHTFIVYEKQIRNLQLQEARLARRREKETAELRALQEERTGRLVPVVRVEEERREKDNETANGFVFSNPEISPVGRVVNPRPIGNRPGPQLKSYTENSSTTLPCTPIGSSGS